MLYFYLDLLLAASEQADANNQSQDVEVQEQQD